MLFARINGTIHWTCPRCNALTVTRLSPLVYQIHCKHCGTHYHPGFVLYMSPNGSKPIIARDTLMVAGHFNARHGVNRTYCDACGLALTEELTKPTDTGILPVALLPRRLRHSD